MAQETFVPGGKRENSNYTSPRVGFFSLKNDGDVGIVRIMHTNGNDFDIVTYHEVEMNGKIRKVNCLRKSTESINKCPFCKVGMPVKKKIFIHLLEYTKDSDGIVTSEAKVWEKTLQYADRINNLINEYGEPLYKDIYKIVRNGAAGDMKTEYNILKCDEHKYPESIYVNDLSCFDEYKTIGGIVLDKSFEDMEYYNDEGVFPAYVTSNDTDVNPNSYSKAGVNDVAPVKEESLVSAAKHAGRRYDDDDTDVEVPTTRRPQRY